MGGGRSECVLVMAVGTDVLCIVLGRTRCASCHARPWTGGGGMGVTVIACEVPGSRLAELQATPVGPGQG